MGGKERWGTEMERGENRGEHVLTEGDPEETPACESHRKTNAHQAVTPGAQSDEPVQG